MYRPILFVAAIGVLLCLDLEKVSAIGLPTYEVDSVSALHGYTNGKPPTTQVYLASYYCSGGPPCQADGGEGLLSAAGTATCNATTGEDGGSVFYDGSGNCWHRVNLNGDLRQWGVTRGSVYDANTYTLATTPVVRGAQGTMATAYAVLAPLGITNLTTNQVSIYLDNPNLPAAGATTIPPASSLSCDAAGGQKTSDGNYLQKPGTIYLRHNFIVDLPAGNNLSNIHNCIILPSWLLPNSTPPTGYTNTQAQQDCGGLNFNYPVQAYRDLEAIRSNMILCHDNALHFGMSGGVSHDLWIYGFDNPFFLDGADQIALNDSAADGNICYYTTGGGGVSRINNSACDVFLTRSPNVTGGSHTKNRCIQVATTSGNQVCNSEYWQISMIQAAPMASTNSYGRRNCRLTLVSGTSSGKWLDDIGNAAPPPVNLIYTYVAPADLLVRTPPAPSKSATAVGDPIAYPMWISNLNAQTGAISCLGHGPFAINIVGHGTSGGVEFVTVDLLESEWGHGPNGLMSATATWDQCMQPPCIVRIVSGNIDAMENQELVTFPDSSTASIVAVIRDAKGTDPSGSQTTADGYIAEIAVDKALPTASLTPPDPTIMIDSMNGTTVYTPSVSSSCDDAKMGQCAFFHTGVRFLAGTTFAAGTSPAGTTPAGDAAAKIPEANTHHYAAGYLDAGTDGLELLNAFSFSHHFGYVVQDAHSAIFTDRAGDENGELDDLGEEFYVVNGDSSNPVSQGGKGGQSGVGILSDFYELASATGAAITATAASLPQGVGFTLTGSLTSFPSDLGNNMLGGKGTASICIYNGTKCTSSVEYITYEITAAGAMGTLSVTSRGGYFTVPVLQSTSVNLLVTPVTVSRPKYCNSISGSEAPVTNDGLNSVENLGGCLQLANFLNATVTPTPKNVFVGSNATSTHITNSNMLGIRFVYENPAAFRTMSGCGNSFDAPPGWFCNPFLPPAPAVVANITLDPSAEFWPCDAGTGNRTIIVPPGSAFPNQTFEVKRVDNGSSGHTCTVQMTTGDTLDGAGTYPLAANQAVRFLNAGGTTFWYITATVP